MSIASGGTPFAWQNTRGRTNRTTRGLKMAVPGANASGSWAPRWPWRAKEAKVFRVERVEWPRVFRPEAARVRGRVRVEWAVAVAERRWAVEAAALAVALAAGRCMRVITLRGRCRPAATVDVCLTYTPRWDSKLICGGLVLVFVLFSFSFRNFLLVSSVGTVR